MGLRSPLTTLLDTHNVIFNVIRYQKEKNKLAKLKSFLFLVLENDCFQSHESHQLSTNIRISASLFFHKKEKMTVKDKIKKFN